MTNVEIKKLLSENQALRDEVERLRDELVRLVERNLDLSEQMEAYTELRRRVEVARELLDGNINRQRNADLQDDAQLLALIELKVEHEHLHLDPDFNGEALARIIGVSHDRLIRLFRNKTIHRSPEAYISNLRVLTAMRLLREKTQYSIAAIANDAGFSNVRALQRHLQDALGMTPVEYRQMLTRDC